MEDKEMYHGKYICRECGEILYSGRFACYERDDAMTEILKGNSYSTRYGDTASLYSTHQCEDGSLSITDFQSFVLIK